MRFVASFAIDVLMLLTGLAAGAFNWCCRRLSINLQLSPCCVRVGVAHLWAAGVRLKERDEDVRLRRRITYDGVPGCVVMSREWDVVVMAPGASVHLVALAARGVLPPDKVRELKVGRETVRLAPEEYEAERAAMRAAFAHLLNEWAGWTHEAMKAKGFYDKPKTLLEQMALINTEVGEATEELRNIHVQPDETRRDENGKPVGFGVELADILIRVADTAAFAGVKLGDCVAAKEEYNARRPYKHGKSC